jgi:hypothetical protein
MPEIPVAAIMLIAVLIAIGVVGGIASEIDDWLSRRRR